MTEFGALIMEREPFLVSVELQDFVTTTRTSHDATPTWFGHAATTAE
jgi:hypothetical protein